MMRARIRAGDPEAFGQAFDDHAGAVFRHAARADGDASGAEDVVSLTFLEAWRIRATLRPEGDSLRPWLLGIATNVLRNRRRAARRHRAALLRVPRAYSVPDFADEVVGRMHDADQLAAAAAALRRLRRADREVFLLCVWSQLDYAAAAEALDIPVGTVRSRLSRARVRLRALAEAELKGRATEPEHGTAVPEWRAPGPQRGTSEPERRAAEPQSETAELQRHAAEHQRETAAPTRRAAELQRGTAELDGRSDRPNRLREAEPPRTPGQEQGDRTAQEEYL